MNKKKKIIITVITSLTIIGGSIYLIDLSKRKDNQEKIEKESSLKKQVVQPSADNQKLKKKEEDDQQLISYFSVFIVFWIIIIIVYLKITPGLSIIDKDKKEPCLYLMFIKMVCEMVCYENCERLKTKNKIDAYQPILKFKLKDFFQAFLWKPDNVNKVITEAQHLIIRFRNLFSRLILFLFLYYFFGYLLTVIVNIIANILFHGLTKTRRQLKISHLWLFIPRMDRLYKKIIAFIFSFLPPIAFSGIFYYSFFSGPKYSYQKPDNIVGYYWLIKNFYEYCQNIPNNNFLEDSKYKAAFKTIYLHDKDNNQEIIHHNLDPEKVDDFLEESAELNKHMLRFRQEGKDFLDFFDTWLTKNQTQSDIFQQLKEFVKP